jgi:glyceraldehyde-3-phosphate dehydrogenase (NAD(P))
MNVLINGLGNIGTTLTHLLLSYRDSLDIDEVFVHKNRLVPWERADLEWIAAGGATICRTEPDDPDHLAYADIIGDIDYVFECRANGFGLEAKPEYEALDRLKGACAQGSEKGFGVPFMASLNPEQIRGERFVHVVSCNTHATASILKAFAGPTLDGLVHADVVVVRRSEDVGQHQRLVGANVVARHLDAQTGTHHGIDVRDLFATRGVDVDLTTSDVTTPSQMMHAARFHLEFGDDLSAPPERLIEQAEYLSTTEKFDSNRIFELGRRYGFQGRIYSHAIVVANNLLDDGRRIKGWMFVPQEGNTLLSTIAAYLHQTEHDDAVEVMAKLRAELLRARW